jgi:choline kinase
VRGIILAAGRGSRLNGTAGDNPKCLVTVGGMTLLERQIRALRRMDIHDIAIVVGCQADRVRVECGRSITYIENRRFAETNSLYSLWMARALLCEGAVILNCDVLFHPLLLRDLVTSRHDAAVLVSYREADDPPFGDEEMKVKVQSGRVIDMAKTLDPHDADAENLGMVKFGAASAPALAAILDRIVASGALREWAPRAFREFALQQPLFAIGTRGYPWIEIDFPADYQRAVAEVLPAIEALARPTSEAQPVTALDAGGGL